MFYPNEETISPCIRRPCWEEALWQGDMRRDRHHEQEVEDDYAWYYEHPERYIWRPRRPKQGALPLNARSPN